MRLPVTGPLNAAVFDLLLRQCQPCISGEDHVLDLDLSSAEWSTPAGLVPLASLLRVLSGGGIQVNLAAPPADPGIRSYYCRMDFFKCIAVKAPCRDVARRSGEDRFIEITELEHPQIQEVVGSKLVRLLQKLPKGVEATEASRLSFIDGCGELVSNTRHAYDERIDPEIGEHRPRALLQAQYYPQRGVVEFCICDCGVGIKRSMEGEHQGGFQSHLEAIVAALAFRNRNPRGDGAGLGLSALHSYIKKNGGRLRIRSGDALKEQRGDRATTSTQALSNWDGTIVALEILVEKAADLSKIWKRLGSSR
jgi:hypothetical protein